MTGETGVNVAKTCRIGNQIPEPRSQARYALGSPTQLPIVIQQVLTAVGATTTVRLFGSLGTESITDLVLQLQQDREEFTRTQTRVKTQLDSCALPDLNRLGRGSIPAAEIEELWNKNANALLEKLNDITNDNDPSRMFSGILPTPGNFLKRDALRNWALQMAALYDCFEMMIEANIRCSLVKPNLPRCRVPVVVRKCVLFTPEVPDIDSPNIPTAQGILDELADQAGDVIDDIIEDVLEDVKKSLEDD